MDERQPLLDPTIGQQLDSSDQNVVDFDQNGDAENPLDWPKAYKSGVVALLAFVAFTV
jgi:hypothetical protein